MRKIYRQIAKQNGVTVAEVRHEIQSALDNAYQNSSSGGAVRISQNRVPCKGAVPTTEEFIRYAVEEVARRTK